MKLQLCLICFISFQKFFKFSADGCRQLWEHNTSVDTLGKPNEVTNLSIIVSFEKVILYSKSLKIARRFDLLIKNIYEKTVLLNIRLLHVEKQI